MSLLQKQDATVTFAGLLRTCLLALLAGVWVASPAHAQSAAQAQAATAKEQPSIYDRIWADFTQWYRDDKNPVVQQVLFTGRFHHDFATVSADQGDHDESNIRRVRFGPWLSAAPCHEGAPSVQLRSRSVGMELGTVAPSGGSIANGFRLSTPFLAS